jgi:hypothetical protein
LFVDLVFLMAAIVPQVPQFFQESKPSGGTRFPDRLLALRSGLVGCRVAVDRLFMLRGE